MIRLSHSAATKYTECPTSYRLHYIEKLRAEVQSSALLFGTALDKSAEHYALTKNIEEALEVLEKTWTTQEINGTPTDLRTHLGATYSEKDLDVDLLKKDDIKLLNETFATDDIRERLKEVMYNKASVGFAGLSDREKYIYNFSNWLCLRRKGRLMLKEFKRIFDDNVLEVLGSQVKVDLENENGDSVVGYIDFVVRWKGIEKPVIIDLKTASRDYDDDAVKKSPQLSLYVYSVSAKYENTRNCGFVVLSKNINKNKHKKCSVCDHDGTGGRHKTCDNIVDGARCNGEWKETFYPRAKSQILIDTVSEVLVERVVENFNEINKAIKAEVFPRNFQSCIKYNGSVKCPFYDLCHNNDASNLICKKEE